MTNVRITIIISKYYDTVEAHSFVDNSEIHLQQLTKTLGSKRPAVD